MRIGLIDYNDLNIVEFSKTQQDSECVLCTANSKYLHGAVFTLFQSAFILSKPEFSYFEKNQYKDPELVTLRNHLQDFLSRVQLINNAEDLEIYILKQVEGIDFMNDLKTFYPDWRIRWERFKSELKKVLKEIIEIVDECIDDDLAFWVKGY